MLLDNKARQVKYRQHSLLILLSTAKYHCIYGLQAWQPPKICSVHSYETLELIEIYYFLGVMDILWSSQLQLTPHKVVKFSNTKQNIQGSNNRGHLWVLPSLSDPRPDVGVLWSSHKAMKKHLPLLQYLKFNIILKFLDKHGRTDWSQEKMGSNLPVTIPVRIRAGGNDHSYACLPGEREAWTFLRDPTME
jgi:hypothetical protein